MSRHFDLIDGNVVFWLYKYSYMPHCVPLGKWETFERFTDEVIEFYNEHVPKTPVPLYLLKAFYEHR